MMSNFEMGEDGFLHQKGRSCILCLRLKENKNNDGYNCKYTNECNGENNYPKFKAMYKSLSTSQSEGTELTLDIVGN